MSKVAEHSILVDQIILETRKDAESFIEQMNYLIKTYACATVTDYCELAGLKTNYASDHYGWISMYGVHPIRVRAGYMIVMPRAVLLD